MMFKRVVALIGMVLMVIGIADTALAEFVGDEISIAIGEYQNSEDTTTQTQIAHEGESRSMEMFKIAGFTRTAAIMVADEEDEAIGKIAEELAPEEETEEIAIEETEIKSAEIESVEIKTAEIEAAEMEAEEMEASGIEVNEITSQKTGVMKTSVEEPEEPAAEPLKEGDIVDPKMDVSQIVLEEYEWEGDVLNSYIGTVKGPNGKETYYNLDMTGVIWIMESLGYNYEYSVREDGVKMYGPFIMVAADLDLRPRGSIIKTSLGWAMVCDTGAFTQWNPYQLDIAVKW